MTRTITCLVLVTLVTLILAGCASEPVRTYDLPPYQATITELAEAIRHVEGWYVGSVSWRNHNPGNLRWAAWQKDYQGQPCTEQLSARIGCKPGFTVFLTERGGFRALRSLLEFYRAKFPDWSLGDLMGTYAPAGDGNHPHRYAETLASRLGVPVTITLSELKVE